MLVNLFGSALNRTLLQLSQLKNILIMFCGVFFLQIFLILLPHNIFEAPLSAMTKLSSVLDIISLIIPTFFTISIVSEKWHVIMAKKWNHSGRLDSFFKLESFVSSFFVNVIFLTLCLLPTVIINFYLEYRIDFLVQYYLSRLLFLSYCSLFIIFSGQFSSGRFRYILGLIASLLIWKLPSLLVGFLPISNFFLGLLTILFPYSFSFSFLEYNYLSYLIPFLFVLLSALFSFVFFPRRNNLFIFSFLSVFFLLSSLSTKFFIENHVKKISHLIPKIPQLDERIELQRVEVYFSRERIFGKFGLLISEFENYYNARIALSYLTEKGVIKGYQVIDGSKFTNQVIKSTQQHEISTPKDDYYFFMKSSNGIKSTSFLGLSQSDFSGLFKNFLINQFQKKYKVGLSSLGPVWINENGSKTAMYKKLEEVFGFDVISVHTNKMDNLDNFDAVIIVDSEMYSEDFYDRLFKYFESGGKIIFITDNFFVERGQEDFLKKSVSKSRRFLKLLGVKNNLGQAIIPAADDNNYQIIDDFIYRDPSSFSRCNKISCDKFFSGVFTGKNNGGVFFFPTHFEIIKKYRENYRYNTLIKLKGGEFQISESNSAEVALSNLESFNIVNSNLNSFNISLEIMSKLNDGRVVLIGDKDIFLANKNNDQDLRKTGMQIIFSSLITIFFGRVPGNDNFPSSLSRKFINLLDKNIGIKDNRDLFLKKIKNLEIQKIVLGSKLISENSKSKFYPNRFGKGAVNTNDVDIIESIKKEIKLNTRELNILMSKVIKRAQSMRLLFFGYSLLLSLISFSGLFSLTHIFDRKIRYSYNDQNKLGAL